MLPSEEGAAATDPDTGKNKAHKNKEDADDYALWFAKEKIVMNGETFQWSDDGVIFE